MKKKFNNLMKLVLAFTLLLTDVFPLISVLADSGASIVVSAATEVDGNYTDIVNNDTYTFDQTTNILNYYFKIDGEEFLESDKYLIRADVDFYGVWDENIKHDSKTFVSFANGLALNNDLKFSFMYDFLNKNNGKYEVSLSTYKLSDIEISGETLDGKTDLELEALKDTLVALDMTEYNKVTNNSFTVTVTNLKNGLEVEKIAYPDSSLLTVSEEVYQFDNSVSNSLNAFVYYNVASLNPSEKYHVNLYLNGYFMRTYSNLSAAVLNSINNVVLDDLINGKYDLEFRLYDSKDNVVESYNIAINSVNSTVTDLNEYFALDDTIKNDVTKLFKKLSNYKALSDEDKALIDEGIVSEIESYLDKMDKLTFDKVLNDNSVIEGLKADSFFESKTNEIGIIYGIDGIFDKDLLVSDKILVGDFKKELEKSSLSNNNEKMFKVTVYLPNNEEASETDYLTTGMRVKVNYNSVINEYYLVVRGNIISDDGMINSLDILEAISLGINSSSLTDPYYVASDVNLDKVVDVLDITQMNYILNDENVNSFKDYDNLQLAYDAAHEIKMNLETNKNSVRIGETFQVSLEVSGLTNDKINGIQGLLEFDSNLIKCNSVAVANDWFGNINVVRKDEYGKFIYAGDELKTDSSIVTFTFEALAVGDALIKVNELKAALNGVEIKLVNEETNVVTVKVLRALSNNANISKLQFNTGNLNKPFDKNVTNYTLYVNYLVDSIILDGTLEDANAKVVGFRKYSLTSKRTTIPITVTAENGEVKTYIIDVVKVDSRSSNNYLKELLVKDYEIDFDAKKYEYNIEVENNVTKLDITATAAHAKAVVSIDGNTNLKVGNNKVVIKVTAENGNVREYVLNVLRKDKEEEQQPVLKEEEKSNSKLLLIILIIATICGLLYLIFKDDNDDNEKKQNDYKLKDKQSNNNSNEKQKNVNNKKKRE